MKLKTIAGAIQEDLDEKEAVREVALKSSRAIVRLCGSAIQAIHKGENPAKAMSGLKRDVERLKGVISEHPEMEHAGFVEAAFQEFAEASIIFAIANGADIPGHRELGITPQAYLEGIGDVVGELRRLALSSMMVGNVGEAQEMLCLMDEIYGFLMRFDYPAALAGVRRKQDVARSLVEKTRGEVAVAARMHSLEKRLENLDKGAGKKKI
ncbi:MAG: translin family protein [Methanobacteriota archaeon]